MEFALVLDELKLSEKREKKKRVKSPAMDTYGALLHVELQYRLAHFLQGHARVWHD